MQWQLSVKDEIESKPVFMEVQDGVTPPSIGDSFHITVPIVGPASDHLVRYKGYYTVFDRQFLVELQNQNGKCAFGWSIVLQKKKPA